MAVTPVKCRRCKHPLHRSDTAARGIGPVCEEREAWENGLARPRRPRRRARSWVGPDLLDLLEEVDGGPVAAE